MSDEPQTAPLSPIQIAALAFGMTAMGVNMTINFVVVAPLARDAGLSPLQVAGILTLSAVVYAATTPLWANLSDRIGRKPVIVFSLFASAITNAAFILALDAALKGALAGVGMFFTLICVRFFFGILAPGIHPAGMGLVAETTTARDRAAGLGLLGAAMGFGSLIGPAGAIPLARVSALAPLWGAVCLAILAGIVAWLLLPKSVVTAKGARPEPLSVNDARVRPFLVFLFIYFVAVGGSQQTLAFLIQDRFDLVSALAVERAGLAFASSAMFSLLIQFAVVQRYKPDPQLMLRIGLSLVAVGYAVIATSSSFMLLCLGFAIVGSGAALAIPGTNALASLSVPPKEQGSAAALMAMAPPAGFVVGPLLGAGLYEIRPVLPFLLSAGVVALLAALVMSGAVRKRMESAS